MDFADPEIEILDKYRRGYAIVNVERIELLVIFDRIFHSHRIHPAFDFLTVDIGGVRLRIQGDDHAFELIPLDRRVRNRLRLAGA